MPIQRFDLLKRGFQRNFLVISLGTLLALATVAFVGKRNQNVGSSLRAARRTLLHHPRTQSLSSRLSAPNFQFKRYPSLRRQVDLRAEETTVVDKPKTEEGENVPTEQKEATSIAAATDTASTGSSSTMSALEGMLGVQDESEGTIAKTTRNAADETKAQHALDLLSGWFGPDEIELEKQKEQERQDAEREERQKLDDEREQQRRSTVVSITTTGDEKMPDEVMRVLGLGRGGNTTDGMRSEMAESLLEDLKERAKNGDEKDRELMEAVTSFLQTAQKYQSLNVSENELRNDFVNLLDKLQPENRVEIEDMKRIQKEILGPKTFFVTSSDDAAKFDGIFGLRDTGYVFCGNFRGDQRKVFADIETKVKAIFEDKYEVLLIPDPELEVDPFYDGDQGFTKAALQVVPAEQAQPEQEAPWSPLLAVALFGFTAFGALQLGGQAASIQLPEETVKWLSNPDNFKSYDPNMIPPGVLEWDPSGFLGSVAQVGGGALAVSFMHEIGHRISAGLRKVKLGTPFLLPIGNLPTSFGNITPIRSMVKTNEDLFDIAAAGPLSGLIMGSIIFVAGLVLTGQTPKEALVAIPYPFVQQSLLLGTVVKAALGVGDGALVSDALLVHPLVVAGWVGLIAQAFNSLPVGALDGGRMVQATFGSGPLGFTSLLTYGALGFGLLGGPVDGLLFGLYLLFLQRNPERYIQDTVTLADDQTRRAINLFLVIFAALVLTPLGN